MVKKESGKRFSCIKCGATFEVNPPDDIHYIASLKESDVEDPVKMTHRCKDCADHYKVDYFDIHYLKRHLRYGMRPDPTRGGWNLFELPEN